MKTCAILPTFAAVALALPLSIKLPLSIQPGGPILGTGLPAVPSYTATGVSNPPPETPALPPFPTISGASTLSLPTIAYGTAVPGVATPTGVASAVTGPVLSLVTAAPSPVTPRPILGALQSDIVAGSTLSLLGLTASIVLQPDLVLPTASLGPGLALLSSGLGLLQPATGTAPGSPIGTVSLSLPTASYSGFAAQGTGLISDSSKKEKRRLIKGTGVPFHPATLSPTASTALPPGESSGSLSATDSDFSTVALPTVDVGSS